MISTRSGTFSIFDRFDEVKTASLQRTAFLDPADSPLCNGRLPPDRHIPGDGSSSLALLSRSASGSSLEGPGEKDDT